MNRVVDVWSTTVAKLGGRTTAPVSALDDSSGQRWRGLRGKPVVQVLDRPTPQTLIVSWCEAGAGRYGYQTWRTIIAREAGVCVLTGRLIRAGDAVYMPRIVDRTPVNADAMISAKSISK